MLGSVERPERGADMAIGVIWYPPVDQQTYDAVKEKALQAGLVRG
jgi:hypothetical protein